MLFKQELFDVEQAKELLRNVCVQKLATYEMLVFDSIHKMSFAVLAMFVEITRMKSREGRGHLIRRLAQSLA